MFVNTKRNLCVRLADPYNSYIKWHCFYVAPIMTLWCFNRQVSIEEGDAKSRESGIMFIETSAKAGFNIKVKFD